MKKQRDPEKKIVRKHLNRMKAFKGAEETPAEDSKEIVYTCGIERECMKYRFESIYYLEFNHSLHHKGMTIKKD